MTMPIDDGYERARAEWARREAEQDRLFADRGAELRRLAVATHPTATRMVAEYDGSGDDGGVQAVRLLAGDAELVVADPLLGHLFDWSEQLVASAIGDGWYNGEGASGTVEVDLVSGKITVHNTYNVPTDETISL